MSSASPAADRGSEGPAAGTLRGSRRALGIGAALLLAALAALIFFVFLRGPATGSSAANGVFEHDCCGKLRLRDGVMLLGEKLEVRYTIGRDGKGPFILPATYAGPWEDNGFETDGTRQPIKLRLDRLPNPETVEMHWGRKTYLFKRKVFRLAVAAAAAASNRP